MAEAPYTIFSLTKMTGREANQLRTAMIGNIETPFRPFLIAICGVMVGIVFAAMLWPMLHSYVIFVPPIFAVAAWFLFERRSRDGLQLRTYQELNNSRKAKPKLNQFVLCDKVIGIDDEVPGILSVSTTPLRSNRRAQRLDDFFNNSHPEEA